MYGPVLLQTVLTSCGLLLFAGWLVFESSLYDKLTSDLICLKCLALQSGAALSDVTKYSVKTAELVLMLNGPSITSEYFQIQTVTEWI